MEKYYHIQSTNYKFVASVTELPYEYRVKFGGLRQCINISVYKDDHDPNINGISFDKKCSTDVDIISGPGTVEMTKTAIKFVKNIFPETRNFMLKDHSKISCQFNSTVPLYYFYLIKHDKTWYQDKFNAKPLNKNHISLIQDAIHFMKNEPMLPLNDFYKNYVVASKCRFRDFKDFIKNTYKKSTSYYEFINKLIDENDCGILQYWFSYFFAQHCQFNFAESLWVISGKEINKWPDIDFREVPDKIKFLSIHEYTYQNGGGNAYNFKKFD